MESTDFSPYINGSERRGLQPLREYMSLLPIFLNLDGRPGLIIGAGTVALDKIGSLLRTGLRLRVVAPHARPEIGALAADGKLDWIQRSFEPSDLDGNFLVIAATDSPSVNAAVYRAALERNILCNSVDDIPNCDFFFGSVVSRGDLQIAISTAGESPAFAQRLRREIDEQLSADLGPWLANIGDLRREVLATHPRGEARKLLLHELAHRPICDSPTCSTRQLARAPLEESPAGLAEPFGGHGLQPVHDGPCNEPVILSGARGGVREVSGAKDLLLENHPTIPGAVHLVGAGPGDPDLLTVKALRLIQSADVILHDDLVAPAILCLAPTYAVVINVGKRCGIKNITQEEINALMIHHARANRSVVRLKSGDPLIFGRAAEEIAALSAAEVSFEVVPGITAAFAAAAAVGCSLTSRNSASNVIFSTGHHAASHNSAAIPEREDATRVVYMPGRDLNLLALQWLQEGLPPDFPCALVSRATQPDQEILFTTLAALSDAAPTAAPGLLIAGWVVRESTPAAIPLDDSLSVTG
jgi:uroporphyrin-III C-methyltransferase